MALHNLRWEDGRNLRSKKKAGGLSVGGGVSIVFGQTASVALLSAEGALAQVHGKERRGFAVESDRHKAI